MQFSFWFEKDLNILFVIKVEEGKIKSGLSAVVGYVATRQGLRQKLEPDVEVHFVPAVSGGWL